jgi:hypothetical protein
MGKYFVSPDVQRFDLPCGAWIEVKNELSLEENGRIQSAGVNRMRTGGEDGTDFGVDLGNVNIVKINTWVVDWSLTDDKDKVQRKTIEAVRNLRQDIADEILVAIEKYQESLEEEKKPKNTKIKQKAHSA